jgi:uncharacterized protein
MTTSQPKPFVDPLVEAIDVRAEVNGRDYALWIRLPAGYRSGNGRYPALLVLDAEFSFGLASDTALLESMWSNNTLLGPQSAPTPEVIIVGVALPSTPPNPFRRNFEYMPPLREGDFAPSAAEYLSKVKDLLGYGPTFGGAAAFLQILREEILPAVDRHYRTDSSRRILFGTSTSGCFATFTLFSQPDLFSDYVIVSPGLPEEIFRMEAAWAEAHSDLRAQVLLTAGEREIMEPLSMLSTVARLSETLQHRKYPGLRLETWFIARANHIQTVAPSIGRALARMSDPTMAPSIERVVSRLREP